MPQLSIEAKIGMVVLIVLMVIAIFVYHALMERYRKAARAAKESSAQARSQVEQK